MFVQCAYGYLVKDLKIVLFFYRPHKQFVIFPGKSPNTFATALIVEYRRIKRFFVSEMPKNHGFRHAGSKGDLFCRCAAKTVAREKINRSRKYLAAALVTLHSGSARAIVCNIVDQLSLQMEYVK